MEKTVKLQCTLNGQYLYQQLHIGKNASAYETKEFSIYQLLTTQVFILLQPELMLVFF